MFRSLIQRPGAGDVFLNYRSARQVLQIEDITKFFDDGRRKSCMERLFDDTKIEHDDPNYDPKALRQRVAKAKSGDDVAKGQGDSALSPAVEVVDRVGFSFMI